MGWGQWNKNVDSIHIQHFNPYFIIFMANLPCFFGVFVFVLLFASSVLTFFVNIYKVTI